ncbi:MAG: hypothetical protein AAF417_19085, partial [Pseudomonadota bacterium]
MPSVDKLSWGKLYIQLTQTIAHPVLVTKTGLVGLPLNKSVVIGGGDTLTVQLPYQLKGHWHALFDAVTIAAIRVKLKLRSDGVLYAYITNESEEPVGLTPRRVVSYVNGELGGIWDADGKAITNVPVRMTKEKNEL